MKASMPDVQLIEPNVRYAQSYAEALEEGLNTDPASAQDLALLRENFDEYMRQRRDLSRPVTLPDGSRVARVPQHEWWMVEDNRFIARTILRPALNETLAIRGGHLGYAVRKSARGRGYGHKILQLALPYLRALGLSQALITCDDDNTASIRIIEKAGGRLQDKITIAGLDIPHRRYLLDL